MPAHPLIESIYAAGRVSAPDGQQYPLDYAVDAEEGAFLYQLIAADAAIRKTLEVGCAYGLSSLHICHALAGRPGAEHTIIDPGQSGFYRGIGVHQLGQAGLTCFRLIEKNSEIALPELLAGHEGTFDFIFIDGWHSFDHALLDCFYATRLLRVGGCLAIDDADMPSVERAVDYLAAYPCYRPAGRLEGPRTMRSTKNRLANFLGRVIPAPVREKYLNPRVRHNLFDEKWVRMAAFRKVAPDERGWNWSPPHW